MAYDSGNRWAVRGAVPQVDIDVGLREYMLRIYNYMASGLALTGIVAYAAAASGFYYQIAGTPLIWVVMLAPLGLVTAVIAALIGSIAAYLVLTRILHADWLFLPSVVLAIALLATILTLVIGFAGTWKALGAKAAPLLRNE